MSFAKQIFQEKNNRFWLVLIASCLPLWLLSIAITLEGFPRPPVPAWLAITAFILSFVIGITMVSLKRINIILFLYCLIPLLNLRFFDEISTTYKTPFILAFATILSAGLVGYHFSLSRWWRWLILLAAASLSLFLAWNAVSGFWEMAANLGYVRCFPDGFGCEPLAGRGDPWWVLFFGF
jgi:hypothetical protein